MTGESANLVAANIDALRALFPNAVTEDGVDYDVLRELLGEELPFNVEKYSFTWNGKTEAIRLAQKQSTGTLRPAISESVGKDGTTGKFDSDNLYIEGDNLEVLKLLQGAYHGRVKMIYIDPPYNTGNDFVYEDDFADNIENYKKVTSQTTRSNPETAGRYHTNWLNMMYPRLALARVLLKEDGVIFISIDDNELANLLKICNEIFGEENYIGLFVWKKRTGSNDSTNGVSQDLDYILCYSKAIATFNGLQKDFDAYSNPDNDPRGEWTKGDLTCNKTASERPNLNYSITDPTTGTVYQPNTNRVWSSEQNRMLKLIEEGRVIFPKNGKGTPVLKRFKSDVKSDMKPFSTFVETKLNSVATKEVQDLFGGQIFSYPKSVDLLKQLITQGTNTDGEHIVMDFFSGSATTAHAVMQLNAEDGGNRRFVMVQLPETTDEKSEAYKAGYKNLCEIGKERIRRAGRKLQDANRMTAPNLDVGFRVFKLDHTNLVIWDNSVPRDENGDNDEEAVIQRIVRHADKYIKDGRTDRDLVTEIMIKNARPLTDMITEHIIKGVKVYLIENPDYKILVCFEKITLEAVEAMLTDLPVVGTFIFADKCFADVNEIINTQEILKKEDRKMRLF